MPKPKKPTHATEATWATEGRFVQLIYSPRGGIEGLLIDTDGIYTQYVTDPQEPAIAQLCALRPGQALVVEGVVQGPSPKGPGSHFVYRFTRLASVDGTQLPAVADVATTEGKVLRFNYARHGAPNGVILDNGDFVHTKPDGFERLGLQAGDKVSAQGEARLLASGSGRVIEASQVNGQPLHFAP